MNKQELERRINKYEIVRECAEEHLNELNLQRRELIEAEKPKLRHGDFGINKNGLPWLTVKTMTGEIKIEVFWYNSACPSGLENEDFVGSRLGNIFDLMEGWGKPLDRASIDGFVLERIGDRIVIGGRRFLIDQAYEFWCKLGQMIMTRKKIITGC